MNYINITDFRGLYTFAIEGFSIKKVGENTACDSVSFFKKEMADQFVDILKKSIDEYGIAFPFLVTELGFFVITKQDFDTIYISKENSGEVNESYKVSIETLTPIESLESDKKLEIINQDLKVLESSEYNEKSYHLILTIKKDDKILEKEFMYVKR